MKTTFRVWCLYRYLVHRLHTCIYGYIEDNIAPIQRISRNLRYDEVIIQIVSCPPLPVVRTVFIRWTLLHCSSGKAFDDYFQLFPCRDDALIAAERRRLVIGRRRRRRVAVKTNTGRRGGKDRDSGGCALTTGLTVLCRGNGVVACMRVVVFQLDLRPRAFQTPLAGVDQLVLTTNGLLACFTQAAVGLEETGEAWPWDKKSVSHYEH